MSVKARFAAALTPDGCYHIFGADNMSDRDMREHVKACVDGEGEPTVTFGEIVLPRPGEIIEAKVVPEIPLATEPAEG